MPHARDLRATSREHPPGDPCDRRCLVGGVDGLTWSEQGLGRDARPIGALAAHQLTLDDGDAETALCQRAGTMLARRTCAEHDDVVVRHVGS